MISDGVNENGDGVIGDGDGDGDGDDWSSLSRSSSDPPLSPTQLANPSRKRDVWVER